MGTSEDVLHGRDSDEGEGISTDHDSLTAKLNSVFSAENSETSTETADVFVLEETAPYLVEKQTQQPVIELPEMGGSVDLRDVIELRFDAVREDIIEHDQGEIYRKTVSFSYDAEQSVIVMYDTVDDSELYVAPEEAAERIRELMHPEVNTDKTLMVRMPDHELTTIEDYSKERLKQLTAEITEGEEQIKKLLLERNYAEVAKLAQEMEEMNLRAAALKEEIQKQPITEEDVQALRSIQPPRKSVQNLLEHEVAQTPKFEALLHAEMSKKSAYEMRKSDNTWREDESKTVPVIEIQARDTSRVQQDKKDGILKRGNFVNADTGITINFGAVGIQDTLYHANFRAKRNKPASPTIAAMYQAQELIENSVLFDTRISMPEKRKSPDTLLMHRMYGICKYEGEYYLSVLSVEEMGIKDRNNLISDTNNRLYNLKEIKTTPVRLLKGFQSLSVPSENGNTESTSVATISIPQLYKLVKTYDKSFYENPDAPGREEREAELYAHAEYLDARDAYESGLDQIIPTEATKQLEHFAQVRDLTVEEAKPILEKIVDTHTNFSEKEVVKTDDTAEKIHAAFEEFRTSRYFTDRQALYLSRLESFAAKHHITEHLVNNAFEHNSSFRRFYINRKTLSSLFSGRLSAMEKALDAAIKAQLDPPDQQITPDDPDPTPPAPSNGGSTPPAPTGEDTEQQERDTYITQQEQKFQVYQIKAGEQYHGIRFESLEMNRDAGLNYEDYDLVYEGNWDEISGSTLQGKLDQIYASLNVGETPEGFTGHSLSVSDVIVTPEQTAHYVDPMGFAEMPDFFAAKKRDTYITQFEDAASAERAANSINAEALPEQYGEQMSLFDVPKIYQVVTYDEDSGADYKNDYADRDEAWKAGKDYIAWGYDGFAILNTEEHKIELYGGYFPTTGIFTEQVYKNSGEWHEATPHRNGSPIHYGLFGNGITVYDTSRTNPETNDYPTVAHISPEGKVKIYDPAHLSEEDLDDINHEAERQRAKYEADWNSRSVEGRYQEIMNRANTGQMLQIGREELSMTEKVAKYEKSVIFGDDPFPAYEPENTDAAEHTHEDVQHFADAFGMDVQQLDALIAVHPTEDTVNQYGSLNALIRTVDREKAVAVVDSDETMLPHQLNRRISNAVRDFVLYGTMPETLRKNQTEERDTYITQSEDATSKEYDTNSTNTDHPERQIQQADDLIIGDRFRYQGKEYTVTALEGLYPDDVTVSATNRMANSAEYTTTMNLDKFELMRNGQYLGNADRQREERTTSSANEFILSSFSETQFNEIKPYFNTDVSYQSEVQDGMMAFAVALQDIPVFQQDLEKAVQQSRSEMALSEKKKLTCAEQLYKQFTEQFPAIADGSHTYERYGNYDDASGYEPLSVEHLGGNVYGFMTSYIQNGDLMRDPDFTFRVDHENQRIEMLEYQQDGVPGVGTIYQRVEDEHGNADIKLRSALEQNFLQNLRNAAAADRNLTVYDDQNGNRTELTPVEEKQESLENAEPESVVPDATPELREILNAYSEKHGLGMLQIEPDGQSWNLGEVMQDGYTHPLGTIYGNDYGMPFTPETLPKALEIHENSVIERGMNITELYGREAVVRRHGGTAPLPKVRDDLPEIYYAENPSQRISNNISAIRELLRLEQAERDGQEKYDKRSNQYNSKIASDARLRQYCGWGGLPQVFDERFTAQEYSRNRLKEMLTPEEYVDARASTLNSHYTPQIIIDAMYKAVQNMDLPRDSRILEPSCGTGNFISRMPSSIGQGGVVGIELDSITARIAKQLNSSDPNVQIIESGFEHAELANNSFDLAIGNVPFGNYNLNDPDYAQDWLIHDAFFRRALDKVAPGGVVALITSSGTLDKANPKIREYLATQADLVGAIRLPNDAFVSTSSKTTRPTADIIFLQKRTEPLAMHDPKPDWCYTIPNEDGLKINSYFVQNPQMVLGKMEQTSHYDMLTCSPIEGADLKVQLDEAIKHLNAKITVEKRERATRERRGQIEPWGKSFTHQIKDGKVYYHEGSEMREIKCSSEQRRQYDALCGLRDVTRKLLDRQKTAVEDDALLPLRQELNQRYDAYHEKYGDLNTKAVRKMFGTDADFPIVSSLESVNPTTGEWEKADIFFRRTVNPTIEITAVQTVEEALQVSLDKRGKPDVPYMATLLDREPDAVCREILDKGAVFIDPEKNIPDQPFSGVVERAEYLSGNVRMKLALAENAAQTDPTFQRNVDALREVIPEDIRAEEISVRMGCAWIDTRDYSEFLNHLSGRSEDAARCKVSYSPVSGEFDIINAGSSKDLNQNESATYGTNDFTMYELAKKILNQRRIVVLREVPHPTDPSKTITRTDATATKIAIDKANQIKAEFQKWIFADEKRKAKYERRYNDIFNSLVGREYDGSKLTFSGMVSDFTLRPHQKNCVARAIYGGNTLAAHVVGAGKSAVMFTTVMKKKELGLINKACVVVPKPLTEQVAREWRSLYPDAKILTVTNDDLSTEAKRNIFTARVATGAYDAVVMSQEQFEKIPMSKAYRERFMRSEIDDLTDMLHEKKAELGGKRDHSVKQIERAKKQLEAKLNKLLDPKGKAKTKDELLEFEQLGFDYLVVDEAHAYKNGFVTTKMTNVAGVTTRPSGRAEDMQMKTDYFNEEMGQGHLLLCTGTPVSNSMTELYVMTRYLRPDLLRAAGVERFDDWAATFGNVVMKNQQGADGQLKLRTCFATFANLPELMAMYKEFADVQSADKLHLPRPELKDGKPQIVSVPASPEQKAYVRELAERAAAIAAGAVDPSKDNLLKITGEARLIGLGNQAIKALYEKNGLEVPYDFADNKDSKVDKCIENVAEIYQQTNETRGVQIIFSDIAVNSDNGNFSVYDYIKSELMAKGIPEDEIVFAPKSDAKNREEIFRDINESKYRVVIASTGTLGTGANIQQNLKALHHIDVPWKPSDFEQREGRILRQGNQNKEVEIYNYVTEGTLDSYLYQTVTDKARFIAQLLDDECPARVSEDCDEKVLTFGEIQAAAEGNPDFRRRIELSNEIAELTMLQKAFLRETAQARRRVENLPRLIEQRQEMLTPVRHDLAAAKKIHDIMLRTPEGRMLTERKAINAVLLGAVKEKIKNPDAESKRFTVRDFDISVSVLGDDARFIIKGEHTYSCAAGSAEHQDNMQRLANFFEKGIAKTEADLISEISAKETDLEQSKARMEMQFTHEDELQMKQTELAELEERLAGLSEQEDAICDPDEQLDPIIETAEEKAERLNAIPDGDADDVKPDDLPAQDDALDPPRKM